MKHLVKRLEMVFFIYYYYFFYCFATSLPFRICPGIQKVTLLDLYIFPPLFYCSTERMILQNGHAFTHFIAEK